MIICSSLMYIEDNSILLIKRKGNEKYYFPGGKPESNENLSEAVIRECKEELDINLDKVDYLFQVIDHAYPQDELVELNLFSTTELDTKSLIPHAEIEDVKMIPLSNYSIMAPAVITAIKKYLQYK
ncbi:NUDIX domain-containing protein [Metaclostridioides mangenotii]|uniref:NUDIX domain-containing protein n=1 Tax=Metaclostridioides mangenotii TaxID=1540 RepID=UPI0004862CD8|nr:NUDIX domain-containing protein [Clostridioides mangenotii]